MNRNTATFALALLLIGVGIGYVISQSSGGDGERADDDAAELRGLRAHLEELTRAAESMRRSFDAVSEENARLRRTLTQLAGRLERLERGAPADPESEREPAQGAPAESEASGEPAPEAAAGEFMELLDKVMMRDGLAATPEEQRRFWELARTTPLLGEVIADLEAAVEGDPDDLESRMDLSRSYVAKLMTVPDGPERGAWALKAEGQWQEVLNRDPEHWEAQFSLGVSWSQWPAFLNKAPDAIKAFERAREIQEARAPEAAHAMTYLQLSHLYVAQGNPEKARETLERGRARHPESEELAAALEAMGK